VLLKMQRAMSFGANGLVFPEGAWNLQDSLLVMKLFGGIYDLAKSTDAWVMPVATHVEGKTCHAILDEPFNITAYSKIEGMLMLRDKMATLKYELMETYSSYARTDLESNGKTLQQTWEETKQKLIAEPKFLLTPEHELYRYIDRSVIEPSEAFAHLEQISLSPKTAFLFKRKML